MKERDAHEDPREEARRLRWALAKADVKIAKHGGKIVDLNRQIEQKNRRLREKDEEIRWVREVAEQERGHVERELEDLRSSPGFRVASGLARRLRRWFPPGTLRRRLLSTLRRAASRLRRRGAAGSQVGSDGQVESAAPETPQAYAWWIDRYEPSAEELEAQRETARALPYRPLISVVVPTWNTSPELLRLTLESVRPQTYDRWELCVADGASGPEVRQVLDELAGSDSRIRVGYLESNEGISGNTNEALAMASGEFVAFLDHTDTLAPFALYEIVESLNRDASADLIYSDWDLISEDGTARFNPFFTPEWSPELILSANFAVHLLVVRTQRIRDVGGLRPEVDGAQDWDLVLRVSEAKGGVRRVPGVLYHWRADPTSAAMTLDTKPRAEAAQRRVVEEHLQRTGSPGTVTRAEDGQLEIRWPLRSRPLVSIVIPTRHNTHLLERCLEAIAGTSYAEREVIVVETAGRTEEREAWYRSLAEQHAVRVLWWEGPFNYSAVNNLAAAEARGEVLVFLNDDTEPLDPRWLEEILQWLQHDGVGAVGVQLTEASGRIQHGGVVVGLGGFADHLFRGMKPGEWSLMGSTLWYRNVSAVTGACLAVTRELLDSVGGWDERFVLCGSDVELCLRIRRAGHRIVVTPRTRVLHVEGATRGKEVPYDDFCLSFWHSQRAIYGGDPYFNPALSYEHAIPTLEDPMDAPAPSVASRMIGRDLMPRRGGDDTAHADAMARVCRVSREQLDAVLRSHASVTGRREVTSINWFIPDFENPFYGGIHTIFRFADRLLHEHGVKSRFVVIGTGPEEFIRSGLHASFPEIADSEILLAPAGADDRLEMVPEADVAISTLWLTSYPMVRWGRAARYFYFVQDFEPMFYPAGTLYALAEETYRMGLYGIANTPPLRDIYESYGGRAVSFMPCVDGDIFHAERPARPEGAPAVVFMYGRPGHPRNCYELAIGALGRLKSSLGERVRIVTAGSWAEPDGQPWLDHLGLLDYAETAELYRRCDAGLVLSVSKHPTYIPMQLMACGALVVANDNPANGWLLRDGENSLLAEPVVDRLHEALERGLMDQELRRKLTENAAAELAERHSDWGPEIERVHGFLCDPGA